MTIGTTTIGRNGHPCIGWTNSSTTITITMIVVLVGAAAAPVGVVVQVLADLAGVVPVGAMARASDGGLPLAHRSVDLHLVAPLSDLALMDRLRWDPCPHQEWDLTAHLQEWRLTVLQVWHPCRHLRLQPLLLRLSKRVLKKEKAPKGAFSLSTL